MTDVIAERAAQPVAAEPWCRTTLESPAPARLAATPHRLPWAWIALGLAGSLAITMAGPQIVQGQYVNWWFNVNFPPTWSHIGSVVVAYAGMAALAIAWLGLGRRLQLSSDLPPRDLWLIGGLWCLPLLLGAALFSRDMYSYMAQGTIIQHGLNPYNYGPGVMHTAFHQDKLFGAVSPFWSSAVAPYGPLFLALSRIVVGLVGANLVAGIIVFRLIELGGVALLAVFVPRLARILGADQCRAIWLGVISPIVLLELIAAGHNDALMIGLMVAGVTLALERRPLLGVTLCAIAATIKMPAAAGVLFIAACWARAESSSRTKRLAWVKSSVVSLGIVVGLSLMTKLDFGYLGARALGTPGRVKLAITPTTSLGAFFGSLLSWLHLVRVRDIEASMGLLGLIAIVVIGALCLQRVRYDTLVKYLAIFMLVAAIGGQVTWPWYLTWGLAFAAACPEFQRSRLMPLVIAGTVFLIDPGGVVVISRGFAPLIAVLYFLVARMAWRVYKGRPLTGPLSSRLAAAKRQGAAPEPGAEPTKAAPPWYDRAAARVRPTVVRAVEWLDGLSSAVPAPDPPALAGKDRGRWIAPVTVVTSPGPGDGNGNGNGNGDGNGNGNGDGDGDGNHRDHPVTANGGSLTR